MKNKSDSDFFKKKLPDIQVPLKAFLIYTFQFLVFILFIVFFLWLSPVVWFGALIVFFVVVFIAVFPLIFFTKNIKKIRRVYRSKYGNLAYQKIWYKYFVYVAPATRASLILIIALKTDYFLPSIISLPEHYMTLSIFPFSIAFPIGILITIFGFLAGRKTGGYDDDIDSYVYLVYPEKSRNISGGLYQYIRHPQYLSIILVGLGFGFIANNWLAISCATIYFFSYYLLLKVEDKELIIRFDETYGSYCKNIPALIPKYKHIKDFLKIVIFGYKKD